MGAWSLCALLPLPHLSAAALTLTLWMCLIAAATLGRAGWTALGAAAVVLIVMRKKMLTTLEGATGDTLGALNELAEAAALLAITALKNDF